MNNSKRTATSWHPDAHLMITEVSGLLNLSDVEQWITGFHTAFEQLPDNARFKIFVNLHGFKAVNLDTHKKFRDIVPLTLADYGWRTGYLGLFEEEAKSIVFRNIRGIQCVGAAHAHQEETKISLYQTSFSSDREQFFTDPAAAEAWLRALPV